MHAVDESPATNFAKLSEMSVETNEELFRASGSPLDTAQPNSNNSARTWRKNRQSVKTNLFIYDLLKPLKTKEYNRNVNRNHLELNEN